MTAPVADDYVRAVAVAGLTSDQQIRLLAHVTRRNEALPALPPVSPAVARSAAALLAADPNRLSGPTAVAQAEALSRSGQIGPALMQIQAGVMAISELAAVPEMAATAPHTPALRRILWHLIGEASELLAQMG